MIDELGLEAVWGGDAWLNVAFAALDLVKRIFLADAREHLRISDVLTSKPIGVVASFTRALLGRERGADAGLTG